MSEMNAWSLAQARDALRAKQVTSVELTEACLSAIEGADALGAFVLLNASAVHDVLASNVPAKHSSDIALWRGAVLLVRDVLRFREEALESCCAC